MTLRALMIANGGRRCPTASEQCERRELLRLLVNSSVTAAHLGAFFGDFLREFRLDIYRNKSS